GEGFPITWGSRVEELLGLGGDHRRHALVMFAFNLNWFFLVDPAWTDKKLLSVLDKEDEDQQAFWQGFFWSAKIPNQQLYFRLKSSLLSLTKMKQFDRRRDIESLSYILLAGWGSIYEKTGERLIRNDEMRDILLKADDDFRGQVLNYLERWSSKSGKNNWTENLPIFFTEVWPRQKQAKSPKISAKLCDLAFISEEVFIVVADKILPLVTIIDVEGIFLPHLRVTENNVFEKHPEKTLELLWAVLPENATKWPYGIEDVLAKIREAEPSLLSDARFIELKRRWNAR
ncbi:MAG TPA: hypothetical protein VN642_08230, partial [Dongiaceae bacterium]|nr:hypothetical protein [Dongiaceae bacterium]